MKKILVIIQNTLVLITVTIAFPYSLQGAIAVFQPTGSITLLILLSWIIIILLGLIAPYIFYPYRSNSAYLIVLMPILFLTASTISSLVGSGKMYIGDYPEALIGVFAIFTITLYVIVNRKLLKIEKGSGSIE